MERGYADALVAIGSVGAVVWTGGLIVRQLYPTTITVDLQNGMFMAMLASFGSIAGLFLAGRTLQITAAAFLLWYGYQYMRDLRFLYRLNAGYEAIPPLISDVPAYFNGVYLATLYEGVLLLPYPVVIYWPNQYAIAWIGFFYLYLGYQLMLKHLNAARPDSTATQAALTQSMGIAAVFKTLQEVLALLKQKL